MQKTSKSAIELMMLSAIGVCNQIIDDSFLKTADARKIVDLLARGLAKVEEIRISRDNWRNKYEALKCQS